MNGAPRARLRVGLLANTFEATFGAVAGGHVHFIEVAKRWRDLDVVVFAPGLARHVIAAELPEAAFVAMPSSEPLIRIRQVRNLIRTVASFVRMRELRSCDVLLATSHFLPDVVPALAARRPSIVCVPHLLDAPGKRAGALVANLVTWIFQAVSISLLRRFASALLVNNQFVADEIGFPRTGRTYVMTHGVEHLIDGRRSAAGRHFESVAYVGRLVETKGVDDLLRAWPLVVQRVPGVRLTIAGTGAPAYVARLEELAGSLGVADSVRFLGFVDEGTKNALLDEASIFAFPSKEEGWGIVLAEAMAHGLPCVTYDLPAYRDIFVSGRTASPIGDAADFAARLVGLLLDRELRERLAREAVELSANFSWDTAARIERDAIADLAAAYGSVR